MIQNSNINRKIVTYKGSNKSKQHKYIEKHTLSKCHKPRLQRNAHVHDCHVKMPDVVTHTCKSSAGKLETLSCLLLPGQTS